MQKAICDKTKKPQTKKAFSLVEIMVSLFIFTLGMVMIAGIFGGFFKSYRFAKDSQRAVEQVDYAMNLMAKTIRTSAIADDVVNRRPSIDRFMLYDFSQGVAGISEGACIIYFIDENKIKYSFINNASVATKADCNPATDFSAAPFIALTEAQSLNGKFDVTPSTAGRVGKVTIFVKIKVGRSTEIPIQTSVSLRDYETVSP